MRQLIVERGADLRRVIASALVIGVPAFFLRFTNDPFSVPKLSLLCAGVASIIAIRIVEIAQGAKGPDPMQLLFPAAIFIAALALSWIASDYRSWALFGSYGRWQGVIPYAAIALFGVTVADTFRGRAVELADRLLWSGAVVGAYAVIQVAGLDPFTWGLPGGATDGISTIGNPNFTGGFLAIVLPVGIGLVFGDRDDRTRRIRLLAIVVAGWLVARSQGGWAAGLAGSAFVAGFHLRTRFRAAPLIGIVAASLIALATVGVVVLSLLAPDSRLAAQSFEARGGWWIAAGRMFLESPIVGSGPDSFAVDGVTHRTLEDALAFRYDFANDPHSVPLAMLANVGLVGLIGFLAPFAWAIWLTWKMWGTTTVWFFGALIAYLTQSLVSIDDLSIRVALWVALAGTTCALYDKPAEASGKRSRSRRPTREWKSIVRWPVVVVTAVVFLGVLTWSTVLVVADAKFHRGDQHLQRGDWEEAVAEYDAVLDLRPSLDYRGMAAVGLANSLLRQEEIPVNEASELVFEASDEAFRFTEELPYVFSIATHARLLDRWALAGTDTGDPRSIAVFEEAIGRDPLNPALREQMAAALIHIEDYQAALEVLDPLLDDIAPAEFPPYWAAVALAAAETGEIELAQRAVDGVAPTGGGGEFLERAIEILETEP